jgi:hypothetical protein
MKLITCIAWVICIEIIGITVALGDSTEWGYWIQGIAVGLAFSPLLNPEMPKEEQNAPKNL